MDINEHLRAVETYARAANAANEHGDQESLVTALIDVLQHAASSLDWSRPLKPESAESSKD